MSPSKAASWKPIYFLIIGLGIGTLVSSLLRSPLSLILPHSDTSGEGWTLDIFPKKESCQPKMADNSQAKNWVEQPRSQPRAHICTSNPYKDSLVEGHTFETAEEKAKTWLENKVSIRNALYSKTHDIHSHAKFDAFDVMAPCNFTCTDKCGSDNGKIMCGANQLKPGCIIYSIGGNNRWEFEEQLYKMTPCEIYTFDCTGSIDRFMPPKYMNDRLHFHHICLSTETHTPVSQNSGHLPHKNEVVGAMMTLDGIQRMLNHTRLDLLKVRK